MNKLASLFVLFRKGAAVSDPQLWKNRQITVTVLAGLIVAVVNAASAFGYSLPIDIETANAIAAGILAIVNTVLTITTTDKVGLNSQVVVDSTNEVQLESKEVPRREAKSEGVKSEEVTNYTF